MYGFSEYTCTLNEPEEGVAPTDSRLRPDQRIMENGDFDGANTEKVYSWEDWQLPTWFEMTYQ